MRVLSILVCLLALCSCGQLSEQMEGAEVDSAATSAQEELLTTVAWAELDGLVSVLVKNPSERTLSRADAVITVLDERGLTMSSSAKKTFEGRCCTAVDVPPGGTFGFYVYVGVLSSEITDVQVDYKNTAWGNAGEAGGPQATAAPFNTYVNAAGSVAVADVTTTGGPIDSALVQAVVNDADGEFVAVISGTWFCFVPGPARRIYMQLYQVLPEGSTIESVSLYPKYDAADGGDANVAATCSPDPDAAAEPTG